MIYNISKHVSQVSTLMEIKRNEKYSNSLASKDTENHIGGERCALRLIKQKNLFSKKSRKTGMN